jgi:hypothetical protein
MIDTDLIVKALREKGYTVERVIHVPENAGEYIFIIDGKEVVLEQARALIEKAS